MRSDTRPDGAPSGEPGFAVPAKYLNYAGDWLAQHHLADTPPTPALAIRLRARVWANRANSLLLAAFLMLASLAWVDSFTRESEADDRVPALWLGGVVVLMVLGQWLIDWRIRRVDQRVAATFTQRATHPAQLGWQTVLGGPHAMFAVATFTSAVALTLGALTVNDEDVRDGAILTLVGLGGVLIGTLVQLRHILARPVVAEDERSLTTDVIMRVEDARELVVPSVVWTLPVLLLVGESLGWWNAVSLTLVVVGAVALHLVNTKSTPTVLVARDVAGAR